MVRLNSSFLNILNFNGTHFILNLKPTNHFNLKFTPIGGVGQIGGNCGLFETENLILIIDAGVLFPRAEHYGVHLASPTFSEIKKNKSVELILTHAHEDHIGALLQLLKHFPNIPIHVGEFCLLVLRRKFPKINLNIKTILKNGESFSIDEFSITPIIVPHSIPETFGIFLSYKNSGHLYISDFKYSPLFDKSFAHIKQAYSEKKVRYFYCDSTNILNPHENKSEQDVIDAIEKVLLSSEKNVFITFFPSNLERFCGILKICIKHHKTLFTLGRSVIEFAKNALEFGMLDQYEFDFINDDTEIQPINSVILVTGSQGDFFGGLRRLVDNESSKVKIKPNDKFIYSAKMIPGNEMKVMSLLNKLAHQKIDIFLPGSDTFHVSGHASFPEVKKVVTIVDPNFFVPIHGETVFLKKSQEKISNEFPKLNLVSVENGCSTLIKEEIYEVIEKEKGLSLLDFYDDNGNLVDQNTLRQRKKMALTGHILVCYRRSNLQSLRIETMGIVQSSKIDYEFLKNKIFNKLKNSDHNHQELNTYIRQYFLDTIGHKPVVGIYEIN
jgi:ribonuclease J